jgi:hypothetical protein
LTKPFSALHAHASTRNIHDLARRLGGEAISRNQLLCPGPGHGPQDRSLSVWIIAGGFTCHSHVGQPWKECKDYVREKSGLPAYYQRPTRKPSAERGALSSGALSNRVRIDWRRIWHEARHPAGTAVETYLAARELSLGDAANRVIRFHPQLWYDGKHVGGMVTLFRDIATDEPTGIIRTFLDSDGKPFVDDKGKTVRKIFQGGHIKGAAAMLDPIGNCLVIGEGLESTLAGRLSEVMPGRYWCLGSLGAIRTFPLLDGVKSLVILGERDKVSGEAFDVSECVMRYREAGRDAIVLLPDEGTDFNDEILARADGAWIGGRRCDIARVVPDESVMRWLRLAEWRDAVVQRAPHMESVVRAIEELSRGRGYAWPSDATIARESRKPVRTVKHQLARLAAMGAIRRVQVGYRKRRIWPVLDLAATVIPY